ncbi:MAG: DsbA family protein, partial [Alphaproteobacteria bacterium]|nr:DsbA family protein [Alphaproteobacteria bacterium]
EPAPDKAAIEGMVRDYLLKNPEVIEEAIGILRAKRREEDRKRAEAAIAENGEALREHPMSPVSGNAQGDVTVVEFFDYRCGFCKRTLPAMEALLKEDANVRVVWKEFPILGPVSVFAARAAMAADRQGKYYPFHLALMKEPELTDGKVVELAVGAGLDMERLRRDMEDPAIQAYLDETRALAQQIGIDGTPAFVIGGRLVGGAVDAARMKELVAAARADGNRG